MRTIKIIPLQNKQTPEVEIFPSREMDKLTELLRLIKLYRHQEEAFFDKIKRSEFAKDEKHHMMKTRKLLDNLLIQL